MLLVAAQAGSGKTTLLAQWAAADPRPCAWITLTPAHDDPVVLVEEISAALAEIVPFVADEVRVPAPAPALSTRILPRFARALRAAGTPFLLVLDDVHHLTDDQALEVVQTVAANLPEDARLALACRAEPALRASGLVGRRLLRRIGPAELAMDAREAAALLAGAGVDATPGQVAGLVEATEGWPAGLYLAALAIDEHPPPGQDAFRGDHHLVVGYVRDELLAGLAADDREFLLGTSVLDRLTGPACDALLGVTGSEERLRDLARRNLLVVPLDPRHRAFRYHHLFQDALRAELEHDDPGRWVALNMRAFAAALADRDPESAIRHALAAGERAQAAAVIWRMAPSYQSSGRVATLLRWLERFTPEEQAADAHLALSRAWCAVPRDGHAVSRWVAQAEATGHAGPLADGSPLGAMTALLRAIIARDGVARMVRDAEAASRELADAGPWRTVCALLIGSGRHLLGDSAGGRAWLEQATDRGGAATPSLDALSAAWLGIIAAEAGDWDAAGVRAAHAEGVVGRHGLGDYGTMSLVRALSALCAAHAGRVEDARAALLEARQLLPVLSGVGPYFAVTARLLLVRAALLCGEPAVATVMIRETGPLMPACADSAHLVAEVDRLRREVEELPAGVRGGPGSLTSAELRILRFLPTHLSFREIGERLHLSRFTVKSHALAAYRKLGVTSRSEAVERAAALGLIEP